MKHSFIKIVFALSLALATSALAGVVFTIDSTDKQTGESLGGMEIVVEGPFLKMTFLSQPLDASMANIAIATASDSASSRGETSSDAASSADTAMNDSMANNINDSEMIYRADLKEMIVIDHETKAYFILDENLLATVNESLSGVAEQLNGLSGMMQTAYETALSQLDGQDLSAEDRAMAEQIIKSTFGVLDNVATPTELTRQDILMVGRDSYKGYATVNYEFVLNGEKIRELWISDWGDLGVGAQAQETLESYFNFFAEMSSNYDEMGFGSDGDLNFFETMDQIGGFPVFGQYFEGGEVSDTFLLESITESDLDTEFFEPPEGYSLRTMGF